ncbi:(2Fe-2S)-binding protein [Ahrensia marina]|uniref:(2Fe-2S)-binding protein n=1 Tax=Ahrensia marina TaxID=1514904 RepID=A0A0N0VLM5_9HYPH|nr:(2Fe-2S)-binding protein [Ahrensia marina]KPB00974.1 (2Fe-2S)-binding protein [Ahrensia marina]
MIVCSCNYITKNDIEEVVRGFLDVDAWQLITVGMVYHALKKRGKCCGCFPNAIGVIVDVSEQWHREKQSPEAEVIYLLSRMKHEHDRCETFKALHQKQKSKQFAA